MNDKEINEIMNEYTAALKAKIVDTGHSYEYTYDEAEIDETKISDEIDMAYIADMAKEHVHKVAIQCLDKILTPELKVFIKNLCYNRLGYPDQPIFYKAFGEYPKEGDKVSKTELEAKGINCDGDEFRFYLNQEWPMEGNFISIEEKDGETYYTIDSLCAYPQTGSEEEWELLRNTTTLRNYILKDCNIDEKAKQNLMKAFNKIIPMMGKMNV